MLVGAGFKGTPQVVVIEKKTVFNLKRNLAMNQLWLNIPNTFKASVDTKQKPLTIVPGFGFGFSERNIDPA